MCAHCEKVPARCRVKVALRHTCVSVPARYGAGVFFFGRTFDLVAGWQRICACAVPHPLCTLTLRRAC